MSAPSPTEQKDDVVSFKAQHVFAMALFELSYLTPRGLKNSVS